MQTLGEAIRRARIAQGLTLAELAQKIGVTGAAISNWEIGRVSISLERQATLEQVLGKLHVANSPDEAADQPVLPARNAFGVWLRKARTAANLSVPELARLSGISTVAIYNIESGTSANPQAETRIRLEKALNEQIPSEVSSEAVKEQEIAGLGALTDFDPHDPNSLPNVPGVYVFYDISERPIYVGKSENIAHRVKEHSDKFWFRSPIVFSASYVEIANSEMRHKVEQVLIKFLKSNAVINKQSVDR